MDTGELCTRWTVRAALIFYVASLMLRIFTQGRRRGLAWSRLGWTVGCLAYLLHVGCAFAFFHQWSHTAAYESTARQTEETVGLRWGGGLYANYAFTLVWMADVCWWWINPLRYVARPRSVEWFVHGFMGFMVFNATVVFAQGFSRWFGIAACSVLLLIWGARRPWHISPNRQ